MLRPWSGDNPCTMRTTHVVTLAHDHWYVQGFDARDVDDLGWAHTPEGIEVPATSLGSVRGADAFTWGDQGEPGFPEWFPLHDADEDEPDTSEVYACATPDGAPEDPRTCSGLVLWLDNQGGQVCQGHAVSLREVTPAEMEGAR